MSAPKNLDRQLESFLTEGPMELPEPSYARVRDHIEQKRQPAYFGPWRIPAMNRYLPYGLAAAAVVVIAVVGYNLLPGLGTIGPGATPSPSPGDGSLPVGPHVIGGRLHGEDRVTVTIPARGWFAADEGSVTKDLGGGDRVTVVVVPGDYYQVPRSTCDWSIADPDLRDTRMPQTADELVAYLAEQTYDARGGSLTRDFSAPEDITIGGSHGQRIVDAVLEYPDSDPSACDEQRFCTLQDRDGGGCLLSHPEPGALDTLWVVDPPEGRNYILVVASSGTPGTALREEVNTLVNSITFVVE